MFLDYFFAPGADEGWVEDLLAFDNQVGAEDAALVEGVQRGVASGGLDTGSLLPRSEVAERRTPAAGRRCPGGVRIRHLPRAFRQEESPVKRLIALFAVAALATAAAVSARPAAPPTRMVPGTLDRAFRDTAVAFAVGTVRGGTITNPRGYEVDLAKAIAAQLGIKTIKWVYTPWTGLFSPGTKKFDVSFQEATITDQRKKTVFVLEARTSTPIRAC